MNIPLLVAMLLLVALFYGLYVVFGGKSNFADRLKEISAELETKAKALESGKE